MKKIAIAAGCFWGVQEYFRRLKGVESTQVGYAQGASKYPSYEDVCNGSGHVETCLITYQEQIISLNQILDHFFRIIDPTSLNRQGEDVGIQYRTGIYYMDNQEEEQILSFMKARQEKYLKPIVVETAPLHSFYPAEAYHQDYLQKNAHGYCHVDFRKIKPEELK